MTTNYETITLAGGCFWCVEAVFDEMKGAIEQYIVDVRSSDFPNKKEQY